MAHKSEFISTVGGFSVKNGSTVTPVINQDGTLNGSSVIDDLSITTGKLAANAVTSAKLAETTIQYAEVSISAADIVATAAGKLGHADGVVLVANPGATKVV